MQARTSQVAESTGETMNAPASAATHVVKIDALADATATFRRLESGVQSYARSFPVVFARAEGWFLYDTDGHPYIDFLAGAGSLNYGHNHSALRERLIDYIREGGVAQSLDLHTTAKEEFLRAFEACILKPRHLDYVIQFPGPTGTNAVEAALKLARKFTGRRTVVAFTNAFHGVSLGALSTTGNRHHRGAAGVSLADVFHAPFDGYLGSGIDTIEFLEKLLRDPSSGIDKPAAVIVETVQGEGGLNVAGFSWLKHLETVCRREEILLIVDDIQAGCGRTGTFFSFEPAGIKPDIVTLSKSLSGFGLPLAVTLFNRPLDCWKPGEHNGTFRGNNHAFVTAAETLRLFWSDRDFADNTQRTAALLRSGLSAIAGELGAGVCAVKGRGLMLGLGLPDGATAKAVSRAAFRRRLIVETSGPSGEVLKCLPPLNTPQAVLEDALARLADACREVLPG
jgi:diaminobutyrate-2-oxoglutarate transaminase